MCTQHARRKTYMALKMECELIFPDEEEARHIFGSAVGRVRRPAGRRTSSRPSHAEPSADAERSRSMPQNEEHGGSCSRSLASAWAAMSAEQAADASKVDASEDMSELEIEHAVFQRELLQGIIDLIAPTFRTLLHLHLPLLYQQLAAAVLSRCGAPEGAATPTVVGAIVCKADEHRSGAMRGYIAMLARFRTEPHSPAARFSLPDERSQSAAFPVHESVCSIACRCVRTCASKDGQPAGEGGDAREGGRHLGRARDRGDEYRRLRLYGPGVQEISDCIAIISTTTRPAQGLVRRRLRWEGQLPKRRRRSISNESAYSGGARTGVRSDLDRGLPVVTSAFLLDACYSCSLVRAASFGKELRAIAGSWSPVTEAPQVAAAVASSGISLVTALHRVGCYDRPIAPWVG